jgi:hypothetical protein
MTAFSLLMTSVQRRVASLLAAGNPGLTHDDVILPIREYRHTH